jgi:alcohol dehydrogenase (cytochrome c)
MKTRLLLLLTALGSLSAQQVPYERIQGAAKEPHNWLTYSGSYNSQRYSALNQITPANVKNLELQWVFQSKSLEKYESTPLVIDGVMYTVQDPDDVIALDAVSGRVFWTYSWRPAAEARPCCGRLSRGVAILGSTLFIATIDARLIAIDAKSGKELWNVQVGKPEAGYAMTHAPLVLKDKVVVGVAGGEFGIRGYIDAYDAKTGERAWRFYTIPGPGEKGNETWQDADGKPNDSWKTGGASVWVTGSYDPDLNLTYWGIGNAGPDWNGDDRKGDNLYSSSVVALDADTGKLKWYYQFSPHNEFDYDATQVPVLVDTEWQGRTRKTLMFANRNGVFYVLDRESGQFLLGKPFVKVTWMTGFDEKGRPVMSPSATSTREGTLIYPGNQGGTNWYNPSYSPRTGLFYIPTWDNYSSVFVKGDAKYEEGKNFGGGRPTAPLLNLGNGPLNYKSEEEGFGAIRAIDPKTGQKKWDFKMGDFTDAGILTTATDLLFSGGREGYFFALDARNGQLLWRATVGGRVTSGPMTYSVNGKQFVAVDAGNSLFVWALRK